MKRITDLAQTVTEGLRADPELRLEVERELVGHLEAALDEHRLSGMDAAAAEARTIDAFGSPAEVAADLLAANRGRLRWRAQLRLAIGCALIPAALILALATGIAYLQRARAIMGLVGPYGGSGGGAATPFEATKARIAQRWKLGEADRLLIFGADARAPSETSWRALSDSDPTNLVFLTDALRTAVSRRSDRTGDGAVTDLLRRAGELDPDNAYFDYLAAGIQVEQACRWQASPTGGVGVLVITDAGRFDEAMRRYVAAGAKPRYASYLSELVSLRRSKMPASTRLEDELLKIGLAAGVLLPELPLHRNLTRAALERARGLIAEGRSDEAAPLLCAWGPLSTDMARSSWCLIELLVAGALATEGCDRALPLLESLGPAHHATAERLRGVGNAVAGPMEAWRRQVQNGDQGRWRAKTSAITAALLPALGDVTAEEAELAPGRQLDYVLYEQWVASALIFGCLLGLVWAAGHAWRWRRAPGSGAAPFLMLPDAAALTRTALLPVLLPLVLYVVYSRYTGWARHDVSLVCRGGRHAALEIGFLGGSLLLALALTLRHVRARCRMLDVPIPRTRFAEWKAWLMVWRSDNALYLGTAARSCLLTCAIAILVIAAVALPTLAREERRLLQADTLLGQSADIGGLTSLETRLVVLLRNQIGDALSRIDPPAPPPAHAGEGR